MGLGALASLRTNREDEAPASGCGSDRGSGGRAGVRLTPTAAHRVSLVGTVRRPSKAIVPDMAAQEEQPSAPRIRWSERERRCGPAQARACRGLLSQSHASAALYDRHSFRFAHPPMFAPKFSRRNHMSPAAMKNAPRAARTAQAAQKTAVAMRTESDSMGSMQVPADALYGATTQRAVLNFPSRVARFRRPRSRPTSC
jgi:hypothetical protein